MKRLQPFPTHWHWAQTVRSCRQSRSKDDENALKLCTLNSLEQVAIKLVQKWDR